MEQNGRLIVQTRVEQVLCDLFEFFGEGLELDFFFVHAYRIARPRKNAMKSFAVLQSIFVDEKKLFNLARFMNVIMHKVLIFKHLRWRAGRPAVSR